MLGFNGGLLGVRKVPTTGSASGLWFQNEQSVAQRAGIWPVTGGVTTRYLRFDNFANTALGGNTIDMSEIRFYTIDTVLTGITTTTNFENASWTDAAVTDGDLSTRIYRGGWDNLQSTATISFDFGSSKLITHTQLYIYYENNFGPRFPATFDVSTSTNGSTYTFWATLSKGTSTLESGDVYKTAKLAL